MEHYLFHISWLRLLFLIALLVLIFIAIRIASNSTFLKPYFKSDSIAARIIDHIYWPVAGVIIAGLFIMKNPVYHGFMVIVVILLSWRYLKELFLGSFIKLNQVYTKNTSYNIDGIQGTLLSLDTIGARFKCYKGTQFFTYSQLLDSQAITLVNDIGSDDLLLKCENNGSENFNNSRIKDIIFQCPFIDHYYEPKITMIDSNTISIKVSARSEITPEKILAYFMDKEPLINFRISNNTF